MGYVELIRLSNSLQLDLTDRAIELGRQVAPPLIRQAVHTRVDQEFLGLGRLIPDGLVDQLSGLVTEAALAAFDAAATASGYLREANKMLGGPEALRATAEALRDAGDDAAEIMLPGSELWGAQGWDHGAYSSTYATWTGEQLQYIASIQPKTEELSLVLREHADAIENFYLDLSVSILGAAIAVGGLVTAITSTIVGAVTAATVAGAVAGAIGAAIGILQAQLGIVVAVIGLLQVLLKSGQDTSNRVFAVESSIGEWPAPDFKVLDI
jgi:hypothetical protein